MTTEQARAALLAARNVATRTGRRQIVQTAEGAITVDPVINRDGMFANAVRVRYLLNNSPRTHAFAIGFLTADAAVQS